MQLTNLAHLAIGAGFLAVVFGAVVGGLMLLDRPVAFSLRAWLAPMRRRLAMTIGAVVITVVSGASSTVSVRARSSFSIVVDF
jgi:hypothetical protein